MQEARDERVQEEDRCRRGARGEIQARLRRVPEVIMPDTWAKRAQRTRQPRNFYQAGAREKEGRPGIGRKDR